MNKTLSVNIGGIVFHIEELAYDKLNRYLDAIKGYFTTSDGRDEIIQDIEGRIGEMFQERITNGKQVIIESDVDQIINIMGRPEQFAGMHEETAADFQVSGSERRTYRRLYRDPDDRVLGGVCSGLGHYLGIDPIWLRIAFAVAFFFFGSGLLLYIILVVVMPKALTTAEKLEMKGAQVNITNIRKSVEDEISSIRSNYQQNSNSGIARFFDGMGQLISGFFRILGKIIAVFFIIAGMLILVGFALVFLALLGVGGISIPFFITDLFMDPWQQSMALLGTFLVIGIPLILIILKAIKVLFKVKMESRVVNWSAFALWIVGIILSITVASTIGSEFKVREAQRTEIPIMQPGTDTLFLDVFVKDKYRDEWFYINDHNNSHDSWNFGSGEDTIRIGEVNLDIIKSNTGNFELVQVASARGLDRRQAVQNARSMMYHVEQNDSLIKFDDAFLLPRGIKYRKHDIQLILKVPEGKSVYLSSGIENVIYDVENVTHTYDGDMVGKTWTMTSRGLECIGCNLEDFTGRHHDDIRIRINERGVDIHGIDVQKDSAYEIDNKDIDININSEGVQIDTK